MNKKTLRILYYIAWLVGIAAAIILIYGIINAIFIKGPI